MKVEIITSEDNDDGRGYLEIKINDKRELTFCDGEPEDNGLGRNFNDCYAIADLLEAAYLAGKNGEELVMSQTSVEWDDI